MTSRLGLSALAGLLALPGVLAAQESATNSVSALRIESEIEE